MKIGSIYSASDKALFDALNQGVVTNADMRQLFLTHGIIISHLTSRKNLAAHFSRLVHDYDDFQALAKLFDTGKRRERLASFRVKSSATRDDFESAAHKIVQELNSNSDVASVNIEDGALKISVRYKTYHFNKSEFKQVEIRDAVVSIEKDGSDIVVRGPQNEKVDDICRSLLEIVKSKINGDFDVFEISLERFSKPEQRTLFFINLIKLIGKYKKYDVTDVFVYKQKAELTSERNSRIDGGKDEDEDTDDGMNIELGVHISRASLKGEGVLESQEMNNLISRGFYISKIIWQAKEDITGSDLFEFEAQFSEPETCTRFSYLVRGNYKYQEENVYSKTRTHLTPEEDVKLSKAIEMAAHLSLNKLQEAERDLKDD